ncbi:MAG: ATP-binding cassette domain-containing protein, partial [Bacillota bacterium]
MSGSDGQIKQRINMDDEMMKAAFADLAFSATGQSASRDEPVMDQQWLQQQLNEILTCCGEKCIVLPQDSTDVDQAVSFALRAGNMMHRKVLLSESWYKDSSGVLLGSMKSGEPVALIPHGITGYTFRNPQTGAVVKVNAKTADTLQPNALVFYKPLPLKKLGVRDLMASILKTLSASDVIVMAAAMLVATLIGLLTPYATSILFKNVIPSGDINALAMVVTLLIGVALSQTMIGIVKTLMQQRIESRSEVAVSAATVARMFSLPVTFFKGYSAGELSSRMQNITTLCTTLIDAVLSVGLSIVFSLIYIGQIFHYAPALVLPALLIIFVTLGITSITMIIGADNSRKRMTADSKVSGIVFSLLTGIQKIKLAGAEKRAFAKWAHSYTGAVKLLFDPPLMLKLNAVFSILLPMIGSILLYYSAIKAKIAVADYMSFNASYAMISGALLSLSAVALNVAQIRPIMDMVAPVLSALPEQTGNKVDPGEVKGAIELSHVSFRYDDTMPLVLNDISLSIKPGQYVAIVGKTGCGKTTLVKLLLGFEVPQRGAVYYDNKNLDQLDVRQLRRNIGVVMQDGTLFTGSIFDNIVVSAPWLTLDDAWHAAEVSGIADDIRAMPMGMSTMISENGVGISGGQRQRLMIARAIAPKPKILILDEATSALDNITQMKIAKLLGDMGGTRIVIAHRLSTVRRCDRILMLHNGKIAEDGTFDELMAHNTEFA